MNLVDWIILAVTLLSALVGFYRGFIRETLSLISWILAFWAAFSFAEPASVWFTHYIESPQLRLVAAFAAIFVVTLLLFSLLSYLLCRLLLVSGIAGTDRILGGLFGVVRAVVLVSVLLLLARVPGYPEEAWWKQSLLIPQLNPVVVFFYELLPPDVAKHLETV
ncbi:MAG: CvpA family protein [Gammaproteobacteria bacterium]|nr:CvpA family protein [Gammaproteobacteria bacterium]